MPNPNVSKKTYGRINSTEYGRIIKPNLAKAMRLIAPVGLAYLLSYNQDQDLAAQGWQLCCDLGGPKDAVKYIGPLGYTPGNPPCSYGNNCGLSGQVPSGQWGDGEIPGFNPADNRNRHQILYRGPSYLDGQRMTFTEKWVRIRLVGEPYAPPVPELVPVSQPVAIPEEPYVPWFMPEPFPVSEPMPIAPPLRRPDYDQRNPARPNPDIGKRPSIDVGPEGVAPGNHNEEPPGPKDREGKKRLVKGVAAGWLAVLAKIANGYTEWDDVVAALYKGLPWQVRRWRGRDGVWRDRDINSVTRSQRLFTAFGDLNIQKAIEEVVKNEIEDRVWGTIGNTLSKRAKSLGEQGLWSGLRGFQTGGGLTRDQWEKLYAKLRKEQGARVKPSRSYTVNNYDRATNQWVREKKTYNSRTTIPWYRRTSVVPRRAVPHSAEWWKLSQVDKNKRVLTRHYYDSKPNTRIFSQ